MTKVLVAFDGSEASEYALVKAIKLIKPSSLCVLYVINEDDVRWPSRIDMSVIWGGNIQELENNILQLHKKHAQKILERAKKLVRRIKGVKLIYEIGIPADVILQKAEELSCDLIVIASRSRSQIGFIGSIAEKVAARSKISVFIVKPKVEEIGARKTKAASRSLRRDKERVKRTPESVKEPEEVAGELEKRSDEKRDEMKVEKTVEPETGQSNQ